MHRVPTAGRHLSVLLVPWWTVAVLKSNVECAAFATPNLGEFLLVVGTDLLPVARTRRITKSRLVPPPQDDGIFHVFTSANPAMMSADRRFCGPRLFHSIMPPCHNLSRCRMARSPTKIFGCRPLPGLLRFICPQYLFRRFSANAKHQKEVVNRHTGDNVGERLALLGLRL
jgi:hypothetical protein